MSRKERVRAAQYLRMSTEHQRYSTENQAAAIAAFARRSGFDVIKTYADNGVSGLKLSNRAGLKQLLADVMAGQSGFDVVLVYDVSRWGRFQNPDQSAHYEFLCAEAGVSVIYCAEPFENDGSLGSTLVKSLKRAMAAEYSRELSTKVAAAKRRIASKGFWVGSRPGYGLRRRIIDEQGRTVADCEEGQRKAFQGCRTILVHGPDDELAVIRRIFKLYVITGMTKVAIVERLNAEEIPADRGSTWTMARLNQVLHNPKYVGDLVSGRKQVRLGGAPAPTAPETWVRATGALPPIIERRYFDAAQRLAFGRSRRRSDAELLEDLRDIFEAHGAISTSLIQAWPNAASVTCYVKRFGSLSDAAARIGCKSVVWTHRKYEGLDRDQVLARLARILVREGRLNGKLIDADPSLPSASAVGQRFGSLLNAYKTLGYEVSNSPRQSSPILVAKRQAMAQRAESWAMRATN